MQYNANNDKYTKLSQELRLTSPAENRLRGTLGLFYQRQTDNIRAEFDMPNLPVYYEVAGQQNVYYLSQMDRADRDYAVFADGTFDLTDKLKLNAGIREFWVNNTLYRFFRFQRQRLFLALRRSTVPAGRQSHPHHARGLHGRHLPCVNTDKKVVEHGETHRVNLQYQVTPDLMVYGTWSTGFRPGGNNRMPTAGSYQSRHAG